MRRLLFKVAALLTGLLVAAVGLLYLAPERVFHCLVDWQRQRAGLEKRALRLDDGLTFVYLQGGQGEPLVLLHGLGGNKDHFLRVAGALTSRYRVIVPDQIGFGESSRPAGADYAPVVQAERLHRFFQALGLARLHLGGNSMGGQIALTYAAVYRDEVKTLWLLDPSGIWSAPPGLAHHHTERTGEIPLLVHQEQDMKRVMRWTMAKPFPVPSPLLKVLARDRMRHVGVEERALSALLANSLEGKIEGLQVPTLIVWGSEDRILNVETAEVLHRLLPRSRVILMTGIGHVPMLEAPRRTALDYLAFRASLPRQGTPGRGKTAAERPLGREREK